MRLYEIEEEIRHVLEAVELEDGSFSADLEGRLAALEMERERKLLAIAAVIRELKAETAAVKLEEDRLRDRRLALENRYERLRKWLLEVCPDRPKVKDERVQLWWGKSEHVEILVPLAELPSEFLRMPQPEIDRALLKERLKDGREIVGARLVEQWYPVAK